VTDAELLAALPQWAFGFVLVLSRAGACLLLLPAFAEAEVPATVRAGLLLVLTVLLLPVVVTKLPAAPADISAIAGLVCHELLVGGLLGFLAKLITLALPMAGQTLSFLIGLSSVLQPDPELGGQATAVARMLNLAAPLLLLISGLYAGPLTALAGSYSVLPPGDNWPMQDGMEAVVGAVSGCFQLSMRLAAPFIVAGTVWQIALGLLSRLVPQLQVHALAAPGQILGGLALLGLLAGGLLQLWQNGVASTLAALPGL
jgi:flagellar biosynthetic protein FliR